MPKKVFKIVGTFIASHWQICLICAVCLVVLIALIVALVVRKKRKNANNAALPEGYDSAFEIVDDIISTDSPNIIE